MTRNIAFLNFLKCTLKLALGFHASWQVGMSSLVNMDFIASRLFRSPGELQNAKIMEVPLVTIHLLILVTPAMPGVSASMVSQWVSYPSSSLLSIPCFRHRNLWWSWQLLGLCYNRYRHPKVLTNQLSLFVSRSLSSYSLLVFQSMLPLCSFFWN